LTHLSSASDRSKGGASSPALRFRLPAFSGRLRRDERGISLIELLVAMILFAGLMAAVVPVVISQVQDEPKIRKSADRIREARALMERLGREVRMAYAVDTAGSSEFAFRTYTRHATCGGTAILDEDATPTQCKVTYSCSGGICTRTEASVAGGGSPVAVRLVSGLLSNTVFTYQPSSASADFVEITLEMPGRAAGEDAITLRDGFEMRNVTPIT
jgi:type II secretory pathway pseudopilin PulG